jgi:hypothetical protein
MVSASTATHATYCSDSAWSAGPFHTSHRLGPSSSITCRGAEGQNQGKCKTSDSSHHLRGRVAQGSGRPSAAEGEQAAERRAAPPPPVSKLGPARPLRSTRTGTQRRAAPGARAGPGRGRMQGAGAAAARTARGRTMM